MNTYKIKLKGYKLFSTVFAETYSKAKYQHYLQVEDIFDCFYDYLRTVESCMLLSRNVFEQNKKFSEIANFRNVPLANIGMKVTLREKTGIIIAANNSCNFDVKFYDFRERN